MPAGKIFNEKREDDDKLLWLKLTMNSVERKRKKIRKKNNTNYYNSLEQKEKKTEGLFWLEWDKRNFGQV